MEKGKKGKKGMKNRCGVCCVVCVSSRDIYRGWPEGKGGGFFFTRVLHTVWLAGWLAGWLPYSRGDERPARRGNTHERRKKASRPEKAP